MKVKDLATAAKKFSTNAAAGTSNYQAGVTADNTWATNTGNSAQTWQAGVQAAASNGSFAKGVSKAGQGKWQSATLQKGVARFQTGVNTPAAQAAWQNGFQPFATVLSSLALPARGPKGSPQNTAIVQTIADALHKAKLGQ